MGVTDRFWMVRWHWSNGPTHSYTIRTSEEDAKNFERVVRDSHKGSTGFSISLWECTRVET